MTLGNEDTELEVSEIVRNTVSHISLDGSGNIDLSNGQLTIQGSAGDTIIRDTGADLEFTRNGANDIRLSGGTSASLRIEDQVNSKDIFEAIVGGNVRIPSGDIVDGAGNVVYDQSANHVPGARIDASGLDADTVDGFEADDLRTSSNILQLTSNNTTLDINQTSWTDIPFNVQQFVDAAYTHDASSTPAQITFDEAGKYRVNVSLAYDGDGVARQNPEIKFNLNGTRLDTTGLTGYIRATDGHDEASNTVGRVIDVAAGDTLKVQTIQEASGGTVTLRSGESVLTIEQLSASSAPISDADTLDGLDSTAFVKTDGSTPITSTQAINQEEGNDYLKLNNTTTGDTWDFNIASDASLDLEVNNTDAMSIDATSQQATFSSRVYGESGFDAGASSVDNVSEVNTTGSGSASFDVYDSANTQDIARFNEGGNVTIPNGSLSVSDAAGSDFVAESGDSMTGRLSMDGNDIYFQPDSDGGSVTALTFESNTNSGSDFGYIEYDDNYFSAGNGKGSALIVRTENDSFNSGSGPDSVVLDGVGGTLIERGDLRVTNDIWAASGDTNNTQIWDSANSYIPASSIEDSFVQNSGDMMFGELDMANNNIVGINELVINDTGIGEGLSFPGFQLYQEDASEELVIRDETNNVDLIRQPKAGPTQFIQGADIGSIEAPEDSLTQTINAAVTSASASGDTVGYTFAVDNQSGLEVSATSDGSGGLSSGPDVAIPNGDLTDGSNVIYDQSANEIPDSALGTIANSTLANDTVTVAGNSVSLGGSTAISHSDLSSISSNDHHSRYSDEEAQDAVGTIATGGTDISVTYDDGANSITVDHNNTSSQGNVSTGGATIIDDIDLDGQGHVTNINTQNRSLDDWGNANANISLGGNKLTNVTQIDGNAGNHRIRFDSNSSWLEITDQTNTRQDLVTNDVYIDNGGVWLGDDHLGVSNAHHSKYTNTDAVSAVNAETSLSVDITGDADTVDGYDIQKNGTDGSGVINFKT